MYMKTRRLGGSGLLEENAAAAVRGVMASSMGKAMQAQALFNTVRRETGFSMKGFLAEFDRL
jgi:hypothetical protein